MSNEALKSLKVFESLHNDLRRLSIDEKKSLTTLANEAVTLRLKQKAPKLSKSK